MDKGFDDIAWTVSNRGAPERERLLFIAAALGQPRKFAMALAQGADVDWSDAHGSAALHAAAASGQDSSAFIERLAREGARIDALDKLDRTPLMRACQVELPSEDVVGVAKREALSAASRANAAALILAGADPSLKTGWRGWTPMLAAAQRGNRGAVAALLQAGSGLEDVEAVSGWTPLIWACANQRFECVEALVEAGASVSHRCAAGMSALDHLRQALSMGAGTRGQEAVDAVARLAARFERRELSSHVGDAPSPAPGAGMRL